MNIEEIREYRIAKPRVTEGFPFNDTALVLKVAGKRFALLDLSEDSKRITLKCDTNGYRVEGAAPRSYSCLTL